MFDRNLVALINISLLVFPNHIKVLARSLIKLLDHYKLGLLLKAPFFLFLQFALVLNKMHMKISSKLTLSV